MKKIIYTFAAILAITFVNSCQTLEVAPPNNITDEQIQAMLAGGDESVQALILNVVGTGLEGNFNKAGVTWAGYSDDNLTSEADQEFSMNLRGNDVVLGSQAAATGSHHSTAYELIPTFRQTLNTYSYYLLPAYILTSANKALLYLTPEAAASGDSPKKFRGQALTCRAYAYMLLMERFQPAYTNGGKDGKGMPIYTKYDINAPAVISSATDTYKFILDDLKEAVADLTTTGYTDSPKDIDLGVAQFLLARAALWAGDWQTCIDVASALAAKYPTFIAEKYYGAKNADFTAYCAGTKDLKSEDNAFITLNNNPEVIMGFVNGDGSSTYLNGDRNVFVNGYAGSGEEAPRIDNRLYSLIDANDFRKDNYSTTSANYTYITNAAKNEVTVKIPEMSNLKFAATFCKGTAARNHEQTCDNVIFRSSEVYLMLAEAYAQSGQDGLAKSTLNKLLAARTRTGATTLTCDNYASMKGMTALQMVELQSRIELWCEGGREYYNNKRWGIAVNRTSSTVHYYKDPLTVDDMTLEMCAEETSKNPNWSK